MKRELKAKSSLNCSIDFQRIARPIPMKRELKVTNKFGPLNICAQFIARPIPMKRELKGLPAKALRSCGRIARPIPMKRELKE